MVTGESHYVWGIRRRLKVIERPGRAHFEIDGDRLAALRPRRHDGRAAPRSCSTGGTAQQLAQRIPDLIEHLGAEARRDGARSGASGA